jgi:demethylmenaquinone methyltransferase/2-methoxy-6-polyprenyl-1,4-benzoquinol methylase
LDIAGGTGDLSARFSKLVGTDGKVILADINASMLQVGRDKLLDAGAFGNLHMVQCDAQYLPFPDNSVDCITIAFGLRNVTDKALALRSMERILKPGGRLLILEFSKPTNPLLEKIYDTYSFRILPMMGRLVANDEESYRYLAESIRKHPDQDTLMAMMEDAGFVDCQYHNMTGGIVAVHRGIKA